ncbi:hypothetical protein AKJ09_08504 [Labilithrix luteola]|uniref:Uncharacterized protein n=1 Tax=Labilithrix luteola TaxID=1391654 RepID=A0A0K1Q7P9_9BACT|nr:hypothetical protein AKJ09_08504 [Labilithrix luteola]
MQSPARQTVFRRHSGEHSRAALASRCGVPDVPESPGVPELPELPEVPDEPESWAPPSSVGAGRLPDEQAATAATPRLTTKPNVSPTRVAAFIVETKARHPRCDP